MGQTYESASTAQLILAGRGLQGRGRGFDMGLITTPDRSLQRQKKPSVTRLFSVSYDLPFRCHGRGQHSTWTDSRLVVNLTLGVALSVGSGQISEMPVLRPGGLDL